MTFNEAVRLVHTEPIEIMGELFDPVDLLKAVLGKKQFRAMKKRYKEDQCKPKLRLVK